MRHTLATSIQAVLLTLALSVAAAPPAAANHTPGATYSGPVGPGGTVTFTISQDGTQVTSFGIDSVPTVCGTVTASTNSPVTITNHTFSRTGSFSFSGSFPSVGSAQGTVQVKFTFPSCDTGSMSWTATRPNHAPVLDPIGNRAVDEGQNLSFTVNATDSDGDTLTYSASNLPPGATFNSGTRQFSWTPSHTQAGAYPGVRFQVSDGQATDFEDITITVNDVNAPPVLAPIGNKNVAEGQNLSFQVSATDSDGDTLTYSASGLPTGASFDPGTRTFSWTPTFTQAGSYPGVHFQVSDGVATDSEDITISVTNVRQASTTTLKTIVRPATIKATGMLTPAHPGLKMLVTLFKKAGQFFVKVASKSPVMSGSGAYAASFAHPNAATCKVTAKFKGDDDHLPSSATKTFRC